MRLQPVDKPRSLRVRIFYWFSQHMFGKVLTTLIVLYARRPGLLKPYMALLNSEHRLKLLDQELRILLKGKIASVNGCSFCVDFAGFSAKTDQLKRKLGNLDVYAGNTAFSGREQAALAFVEAATRNRKVEDPIYAKLQLQFTEAEIVELVWLNALENFLNLTTVPLEIGSDELCEISSGRGK